MKGGVLRSDEIDECGRPRAGDGGDVDVTARKVG